MPPVYRPLLLAAVALGASGVGATAGTLEVGPNARYKQPSEAIAAAGDGDVVSIAPGQYFDCAIIRQSALTIQGSYVGNVKELRSLVGIAKEGKIPPIPIAQEPLRNADAVLNRLRDGKVVGRVVLTA